MSMSNYYINIDEKFMQNAMRNRFEWKDTLKKFKYINVTCAYTCDHR